MKKILTCALAAATMVGSLGFAGEASAQRWHGGGHGGGYDRHDRRDYRGRNDGAAIALGVLAGATLLGGGSSYVRPGYGYGYGYAPRPYRSGYYYSSYRPRCWTEARWDPYYGRVFDRVCR